MSPARRSRLPQRRSPLLVLLLSLVILLPALPMQPVAASLGERQPDALSMQEPPGPHIAFLRQGNLWLMNGDGSDPRQITDYPEGVTQYSWSPSGRYILLQHGGRFWHWMVGRADEAPEARLTLYDAVTGELRDIMAASTDGQFPRGRFPSWAQDADELLMEVAEGNGSYSIVRIGLDGTIEPVSTYLQRQTCGGPDGPMTIMMDLLWVQELGSPFAREAYQGVVWWADSNTVYINPECGNGISLNLENSTMVEYPRTVWLTASNDRRILVQDYALVGGESAGVFDPATGTTMPIAAENVLAWGPDGEIVSTTVTRGAGSAFTSDFDDVSGGYSDNTVEIWRADSQGSNVQHVATLDVQGTGIPSVASDGAIIVGTVDNPTALMAVDTSRYREYSPDIYTDHQKVLRIDAGGEVTELTTNAYRPRLQPAGIPGAEVPTSDEEGPSDVTETPLATATAAPNEVAEQPVDVSGDGWIAYVGEDGNIWLMKPDGSKQTQLTTDGTSGSPYRDPSWSHDGTVLVFYKTNSPDAGIMVYRNGTLTPVPNTARCGPAAVSLDNSHLLYSCAGSGVPYETKPTVDQLANDPQLAAIASSNLDGTNARVLVPYTLPNSDQNGIPWVDSGLVGFNGLSSLAVNPSTGEILATFGLLHSATAWLVEPDGAPILTSIPFSDSNQDRLGPFIAEFLPGSEQVVALVCEQGCYPDYEDQIRSILILNRDGSIAQRLIGSDTMPGLSDFTVSPDATTLVFSTYSTDGDGSSMLWSMPIGNGATSLHPGSSPAWQPNPGVTPQVPASSGGSQAIHPSGSAETTTGPSSGATSVPDTFLGTWDGRAMQVNPSVEWPVTIDLTGGGTGSVVGTSVYPNDGCGGDLVLQDATADTIVLVENLTYGLDACTDGGTITLGLTSDTTLNFNWAGIRKDGSASSATGSLTRSQPSADTSVPAPVAASVPEGYIASWSGTGVQVNPAVEWPVTITITGGSPGAVVGTSSYPEQSCGGNLILQDVTSDAIVMLEQLTYGQNACTDGGTITLSGLDAVEVQFAWTGTRSDGSGSSATGTLYRPDSATGSSGEQATTQTGDQGSDGPIVDTTQLNSWYIGTFSGTGEQENPDSKWPITIIFTGGRPGEVIGTVEYPTLGCGGELVLVSINPNDEWLGFKATERITYGHNNCIDGGTFAISNESAVGIIFHWTSPVSATTAGGNLPRVEPGAASAPIDPSAEASGAAQLVTPASEIPTTEEPEEADASSGGPPSTYDAPTDEEIVPIEPGGEGG